MEMISPPLYQLYLERHEYGNAETSELWDALQEVLEDVSYTFKAKLWYSSSLQHFYITIKKDLPLAVAALEIIPSGACMGISIPACCLRNGFLGAKQGIILPILCLGFVMSGIALLSLLGTRTRIV